MSQETRTLALRRLTPLALALSLFAPARVRSAEGDVRIGAVLPLTGKESKAGGAYRQGTEFAVKEINDSGGIAVGDKKLKIDLTLFDDTTDAAKSAQLVEQLVRQTKVHAIIGGYTSPIVQAESVVADEYGVPFISGGAAALSIYSRSKWVFGTLSPVSILSSTQMLFPVSYTHLRAHET